jgi:hypothetical protein
MQDLWFLQDQEEETFLFTTKKVVPISWLKEMLGASLNLKITAQVNFIIVSLQIMLHPFHVSFQ